MRLVPEQFVLAVIAWLPLASTFVVPKVQHGFDKTIIKPSLHRDSFRLHVWGGNQNNNRFGKNQYQNRIPQKSNTPLDTIFRPFNEAGDKLSNAVSNLISGGKQQQVSSGIPGRATTRFGRQGGKKSYMKKVKTSRSNVEKIRPPAQPAAVYNSYIQPTPSPITTSSPYFQQQSTVDSPFAYSQQQQQQQQLSTTPDNTYSSYFQPPTISPVTTSSPYFQSSPRKPAPSPNFFSNLFKGNNNNEKRNKFGRKNPKKFKMNNNNGYRNNNNNRSTTPNFFNTNIPPTSSPSSKPLSYFPPTYPAATPAPYNTAGYSTQSAPAGSGYQASTYPKNNSGGSMNSSGVSPQFSVNSNGVSPRFPNSNGVSPQFPNYGNGSNGASPQFPNYANGDAGMNSPPQLSTQDPPPGTAYGNPQAYIDPNSQYMYNNNGSPQYTNNNNNNGVSPRFPTQAQSTPMATGYQGPNGMNRVNSPYAAPTSYSPAGVGSNMNGGSTIPIGAKMYGQTMNNNYSQPSKKTYLKKYRNDYSYDGRGAPNQRSSYSNNRTPTTYSRPTNYRSYNNYSDRTPSPAPRGGNQLSSEAGPPRSIAPIPYGGDNRQRSKKSYIKKVKSSNYNSYRPTTPPGYSSNSRTSTYVPGNRASYDYSVNNRQPPYRRPPSGNQLPREAGLTNSIAPVPIGGYNDQNRSNGSYNGSYQPPSYIGVGGSRPTTYTSGNYGRSYGNSVYSPSASPSNRGNQLARESGLPNSIAPIPVGSEYERRNSQDYYNSGNSNRSYLKKAKVASLRQPYNSGQSYRNDQVPRNRPVNWSL